MLWSCLPAKFTKDDFENPFTVDHIDNVKLMSSSIRPKLLRRSVVRACKDSSWDRTCSYWVSFHSLALRAERMITNAMPSPMLSSRQRDAKVFESFIPLLVTTIFGGLTQCRG